MHAHNNLHKDGEEVGVLGIIWSGIQGDWRV